MRIRVRPIRSVETPSYFAETEKAKGPGPTTGKPGRAKSSGTRSSGGSRSPSSSPGADPRPSSVRRSEWTASLRTGRRKRRTESGPDPLRPRPATRAARSGWSGRTAGIAAGPGRTDRGSGVAAVACPRTGRAAAARRSKFDRLIRPAQRAGPLDDPTTIGTQAGSAYRLRDRG